MKTVFRLMTSSNQISKMLRKRESFNSHTVDSRWTKLAVLSNNSLKKLFNRSEFLFSFLFSFHRMAPNGTMSHKFNYDVPLTGECNIFNWHPSCFWHLKNVRIIFETSDTRLLEALCDVRPDGNNDFRQKYSIWLWRKNLVWLRPL